MGEVFISRTSDMAEYPAGVSFVAAAVDAVIQARRLPVDMRYFAARDGEPASYCRQRVREAEVYVAVVGLRYGSLVPGEDVSYTEQEFQEATTAGKSRLVFLLDEDAPIPRKFIDRASTRIDDFRTRLQRSGLVTATFTTPAELRHEIFKALSELPAGESTPAAGRYGGAGRLPALVGPYLAQVRSRYQRLDLDVLTPAELDDHLPVLLHSVFVPQGVRALAASWAGHPDTRPLLADLAAADTEGWVRVVAVQALAAGWADRPDTRRLLVDCAIHDGEGNVRVVAVQALAAGWADHLDTRPLLVDRATADTHGSVRRAAVQALAAGWPDHSDTRPVLAGRATADTDESVRQAAAQALRASRQG